MIVVPCAMAHELQSGNVGPHSVADVLCAPAQTFGGGGNGIRVTPHIGLNPAYADQWVAYDFYVYKLVGGQFVPQPTLRALPGPQWIHLPYDPVGSYTLGVHFDLDAVGLGTYVVFTIYYWWNPRGYLDGIDFTLTRSYVSEDTSALLSGFLYNLNPPPEPFRQTDWCEIG